MNTSKRQLILSSILICALAVAVAGSASPVIAGQSKVAAKHALVQIIRDQDGNPVPAIAGAVQTFNWSGYVLPKFVTGVNYTSAQGTWIVPLVIYDGVQSASSNWVGIGGFCANTKCNKGDKTLIQLGTFQESDGVSVANYSAWYEMLPKFAVTIPLTVHHGDVMTASLSCPGKCKSKQKWTLSMTDETTGNSFSKTFTYKSSKLSAEWIEEAPSDNHGIIPLADFDKTSFTESMENGVSADLNNGVQVVMEQSARDGKATSNVSAPDSTMDGFSACFGTNGMLTPCFFTP